MSQAELKHLKDEEVTQKRTLIKTQQTQPLEELLLLNPLPQNLSQNSHLLLKKERNPHCWRGTETTTVGTEKG